MKKINILFTLILLAFVGCQDRNSESNTLQGSDRISITAKMPQSGPSTRVELVQSEGAPSLQVKFTEKDNIYLFVSQEGVITELKKVTPKDLSDDGLTCKFDIELPSTIDKTKAFSLIGFTGSKGRYLKAINAEGNEKERILMNVEPIKSSTLEDLNPPLYFKIDQLDLDKTQDYLAFFKHMGAYEIVTIKNTSQRKLEVYDGALIDASSMFGEIPWTYVRSYSSTKYPVMDLISGEVLETTEKVTSGYGIKNPVIGENETVNAVTWYLPKAGVKFKDMAYKFLNRKGYKSVTSKNIIPAKDYGPEIGKAYHAYATFDGVDLTFTESDGTPKPEPYISFVTDIPVGKLFTFKVYLNYGDRAKAYIDLNGNGEKDIVEKIQDVYRPNRYSLERQDFTIYGKIITMEVPEQQLTKVELSPACTNLVGLDVSKNNLSEEALNTLIEQLPDITDVKEDIFAPKTLKIDGNPGTKTCNAKLAIEKGWKLDIMLIDESQPYTYLLMKPRSNTIYLTIDAEEADREGCWIDLNGDAVRDDNEGFTDKMFGRLLEFNYTAKDLILYGNFNKLDLKENGTVMALEGVSNTKIKYLNVGGNGTLALFIDKLVNLEYLGCEGASFHANYPLDVTKLSNLKVLDCSNASVVELDLSNNPNLLYLNCANNNISRLELDKNGKLKTLICSNNDIGALDLAENKSLRHVEIVNTGLKLPMLNAIITALPDLKSSSVPGGLWIANNPGTSKVDITPAKKKNWDVDVKNLKGDNRSGRKDFIGEDL